MQFKKLFLFFVTSAIVIGVLGFSIWHRWNAEQKIVRQQLPQLTPIAEFNHGARIQDIALSPVNPNLVASVSMEDSMIKVWNRNNTDTPVITLTDPDKIGYIAFSTTDEWLVSKSFGWLIFWDISTGAKIGVFEIHSVADAISPDGHLLATASNDVKLWNIGKPNDVTGIAVLPPKMGEQALSHEDARSARHHNETINQHYRVIDFSSDGKWIAAGGSMPDVNRKISRGVVKIWDLQRRQLIKIFPRELPKGVEPRPNTDYSDIRSIKFSPDNRFFASVGSYGYTIWTLPEWYIHCNVRAQTGREGFIRVDDKKISTSGYIQSFNDLAFSPDGKMYAVADLRTVTLYSTESTTPIALLKGGGLLDLVNTMTFSQDGSTLVSGGIDGIVRLWDIGGLNEK